jgi:hypothetical protein
MKKIAIVSIVALFIAGAFAFGQSVSDKSDPHSMGIQADVQASLAKATGDEATALSALSTELDSMVSSGTDLSNYVFLGFMDKAPETAKVDSVFIKADTGKAFVLEGNGDWRAL